MDYTKTSVLFTIQSVQYGTLPYSSSANHDPEGDSSGTALTVYPPMFHSLKSTGGSVLELAESSGTGGKTSGTATTFNLGDDNLNKQYRAILSFNTSSLPDRAVITGATLTLTQQSFTGHADPFSLFQGLLIDVRKGFFGRSAALEARDFQAAANLSAMGPYSPSPVQGVYTIDLSNSSLAFINKGTANAGVTQFRLRFQLDDNADRHADFITFYSSYSSAVYRPTLTITYYVP